MIKDEHQKAVQDLLREQLKGIDLSHITEFDKLEGNDHRKFCKYAFTTFNSPFFKEIVKNLVYAQVLFSVNHAANYDETTFGRATVNGVSLMEELFAKYAREYENKYLPPSEKFDKHQLISK
jgi:hypothetical protein